MHNHSIDRHMPPRPNLIVVAQSGPLAVRRSAATPRPIRRMPAAVRLNAVRALALSSATSFRHDRRKQFLRRQLAIEQRRVVLFRSRRRRNDFSRRRIRLWWNDVRRHRCGYDRVTRRRRHELGREHGPLPCGRLGRGASQSVPARLRGKRSGAQGREEQSCSDRVREWFQSLVHDGPRKVVRFAVVRADRRIADRSGKSAYARVTAQNGCTARTD